MTINFTTGASASIAVAGTSLAFSANTLTNGQLVVVAVAILTTTVSVSGIADTGGNTYSLVTAQNDGTG